MVEQPYEAEALLQILLATHPDLLAGDQVNPTDPRRWLLVEREAGVPAEAGASDWWAVDHLFLDQDAIPTFVEVKRAADTRVRREVVAQMLDYAANATEYWPVDRMRELFALRCAALGIDQREELGRLLGPDGDEAEFWDLARTNLRDGRVRLLFVADRIPPSLRRIVEFLNRQMDPAEVLAVEVRQFTPDTGEPLRTLVPRVIGQTEQARQMKTPARPAGRRVQVPIAELVERLRPEQWDLCQVILSVAEDQGFAATAFRRSDDSGTGTIRFALPSVQGVPASLDSDFLWVSLGRHHSALRDPTVNLTIRQAVRRVSPTTRQIDDPKKVEVGVALDSIRPDGRAELQELFGALRAALDSPSTDVD
jgi:hypothetical protein